MKNEILPWFVGSVFAFWVFTKRSQNQKCGQKLVCLFILLPQRALKAKTPENHGTKMLARANESCVAKYALFQKQSEDLRVRMLR